MKRLLLTAALLEALLAAAAPLRIVDATRTGMPQLASLTYLFHAENPSQVIRMQRAPAKKAAELLQKGEADLVVAEKRDAALFASAANRPHPSFALQAVTVSVHPNLSVSAIKLEELRSLLAEPLPKWSRLQKDAEHDIHLFSLKQTVPGALLIDSLIWGNKIVSRGKIFRADSSRSVLQLAALDPSSLAIALYLAKPPAMVKHLAVNGVVPTEDRLKKGEYPLATFFFCVTSSQTSAASEALLFVKFLTGDSARGILAENEFLPL